VPLHLPNAVYCPRPRVITSALTLRILARLKLPRAKPEQRLANNFNHLQLKVKAAAAQPDVGDKRVEAAAKLQRVIKGSAAAAPMASDNDATSSSMQLDGA
jgi:hypothetical protein